MDVLYKIFVVVLAFAAFLGIPWFLFNWADPGSMVVEDSSSEPQTGPNWVRGASGTRIYTDS